MTSYIMSIDEGTTGVTVIIFNKELNIISKAYKEFPQIFPKPGWVEHDPLIIWNTVQETMKSALEKAGEMDFSKIKGIGITNQRETVVVWDKNGNPVTNAIVWQDRRTATICDSLRQEYEKEIQRKTGLVMDPYFSATKIKWLLDNVPSLRDRAKKGEIMVGTIDSWVAYKLSGGKLHITDHSNASRTMLFNIHKLEWDDDLLELFRIPKNILPELVESSDVYGNSIYGPPIAGIAGDQQAALFGQACFHDGMVKNTYGTGAFILTTTSTPVLSRNKLLTTVAWTIDKRTKYALEGSVFIAGAVVQWIRDGLKFIDEARDSEYFATKIQSTEGVYLVPAFAGLGAPYWDPYARGLIIGLTRGTKKEHIIRAALESIAYQTRDVIEAMKADGCTIEKMRVDGGAAVNNFLMQFQADILGIPVERPKVVETTGLGAAGLAGISVGLWSLDKLEDLWKLDRVFRPKLEPKVREELYAKWKEAVKRAMKWAK